jgi:VWFA-related protein
MTTIKAASLFASGFLLLSILAGATVRTAEPPPEDSFADEINVSISTMVVRVVDTWGRPILGLKPEDFQVRVDGRERPVLGVDWIGAGEEEVPRLAPEAKDLKDENGDVVAMPALPGSGRLVVFFVQASINTNTRISGHMRMRSRTRKLLDTLHPADKVAVVSHDSHLKLWQDFTEDRDAVHAAIDRGVLFTPEAEILPAGSPSLARNFDFAAAKRAASPERALELTAWALESLPGEKTVIFLGWGLGRAGGDGVRMTPAFSPAVRALKKAHAAVFVLDVTSADEHDLGIGLQDIASATGGLYLSTFRLPDLATEIMAKAISGYYILTIDPGELPEHPVSLRIDVSRRDGTVLIQ